MERRGNYFMASNGQIGFSPLHMLGLSAIHPKSMQQGFVDISVNTHTMDNNFTLFNCKDQDTEVVNMNNNITNPFGGGLPVGNSFSKLISGFIGSKCLVGSSTGRGYNFWGRVWQQYNDIIGTNSNLYISVPAVNTKGNTREYIKAGAVDTALLISQSFDLFSSSIVPHKQETVSANRSSQELQESFSEMKQQERTSSEPKQSYAEIAKSAGVSKSPCSPVSDRCSTGTRRSRTVRRNSAKLRRKGQSSDSPSNNNWRYRGDPDILGKQCIDSKEYYRELHCVGTCDTQRKSASAVYSAKRLPHLSVDQKINYLSTRNLQHPTSSRKPPGKRRLSSNLLIDIKEDCLSMDNDLMAYQKKEPNNYQFSYSSKSLVRTDHRSVSYHCQNWRCRPYSLCEPCKREHYFSDAPERHTVHTKDETNTYEIEDKENNKENNVPEISVTPLSEVKPDVMPLKEISCSDSSLAEGEIFIATACPVIRTRMASECSVDSEDSFIIMFDANDGDSYEETNSSGATSECSGSDTSDDDDSSISSQCFVYEESSGDDDGYDEVDFNDNTEFEGLNCVSETELKVANARWESAYEHIPSEEKEPKKVQFAELPELETVHKIIAWDFAYRAARVGPWELIARDRIRFNRRIEHVSRVVGPVLQDNHRRHMWQKFHKDALEVP